MKPQMPEPDFEGQMAKSELYRAAKHSMKLFQMIQDGQQLEGWVQAKITKAADYLDTIYHYMEYQVKFGNGGVAASVDDITGEADMSMKDEAIDEEDDEVDMKEGLTYEQRLEALLEGKVKKMTAKKKPAAKMAKKSTDKKSKKEEIETEGLDMNLLKSAQGAMSKNKKDSESDANVKKPYGYRGSSGADGDEDAPAKKAAKKSKGK